MDWVLPTNHFDGISDFGGYVSYWEKVGEVDFGDDLKLPLIINFRSNRETTSPYLGHGWLLALLESNMVQTGESNFKMVQPDGMNNYFIRLKPEDTTLEGSAGWKGEINGDTITTWAPCGWKIEFRNGHIASLTSPKDRKLEFVYATGNMATEIRENGKTFLKVEQDPGTGEAKALLFNDKRMEIALDQKPKVQRISGQNLIGAIERSLKSLNPTEGPSKTFDFAVNDKIQPTLKITGNDGGERLFTWNPVSKRVISDNDWTYKIEPQTDPTASVVLSRINVNKQSEYWYDDVNKGVETDQDVDGIRTITIRFVSGLLAGRLRMIKEIRNGHESILFRASYDEYGRLIKQVTPLSVIEHEFTENSLKNVDIPIDWSSVPEHADQSPVLPAHITYKYDSKSQQYAKYCNGVIVWQKFYSDDGVLTKLVNYSEGFDVIYKPLSGGEHAEEVYLNSGSSYRKTIDGEGKLVSITEITK